MGAALEHQNATNSNSGLGSLQGSPGSDIMW